MYIFKQTPFMPHLRKSTHKGTYNYVGTRNLRIPFTQRCFRLSFVEIGPVVLENKIFKICQFCNYLLLEKGGGALHLNKLVLESPLSKDAFCLVWMKLAKWFWRRRWKCENFATMTRTTTTMTTKTTAFYQVG